MGAFEYLILLGGAIFVVAGLARLGHFWHVIRSNMHADNNVTNRMQQLHTNHRHPSDETTDESDDLGIALALALRDAEGTLRRGEED
jgi:hypothetical protein